MKRLRLPGTPVSLGESFRPQLRVLDYISTKKGDAERGSKAWMRPADAMIRALAEGQLVWVEGPRRKEVAVLDFDDSIPQGSVRLRDIAGIAVSEHVTITSAETDAPRTRRAR